MAALFPLSGILSFAVLQLGQYCPHILEQLPDISLLFPAYVPILPISYSSIQLPKKFFQTLLVFLVELYCATSYTLSHTF